MQTELTSGKIDLIKKARVVGPGGNVLYDREKVEALIKSVNKISRVSFIFDDPVEIEPNSIFYFDIQYKEGSSVAFDILKGDFGMPEIHIESKIGETISFMRGNMKDFLSLKKINDVQSLELPIGSFVYNTFIKTNSPKSDNFFKNSIQKIIFDFLGSPLGDANVRLKNMYIRKGSAELPAAISLISMWATDKYQDAPISTTQSDTIAAQLVGKDFFIHTFKDAVNPRLLLTSASHDIEVEVPIGTSPTAFKIPVPAFGEIGFEAAVYINEDQKIAENTISATRMYPATPVSKSKMGLSDGANFHQAHLLGGEYLRLILPLSTLKRKGSGFEFRSGYDVLPVISSLPKKWIVSFKFMTSFLFKKEPHPHRLGPSDFGLYREMLQWLIPRLLKAGVYGFEGWNEANVIHEWYDSIETLCEMQQCLYEVVREHSDVAMVLSPSSTTWDFDHFENLERGGVLEYSDGLAFHAYTYNPYDVSAQFDRLEQFIEGSSLRSKSAFLTEVGFRSPAFSNFEQATYFSLFTIEAFFRDYVKSMIWFRYQNPLPESFGSYKQNSSAGYALVGYGGLYSRSAISAYRFFDMILSETLPLRMEVEPDLKSYFGIHGVDRTIIEYSEKQKFSCLYEGYVAYDIFGNRVSPDTVKENLILVYFEKPLVF